MHTILSVQEAFAAKQAGKNIVCRHAESEFFEELGNVSAEIWFDPHYVFALQIDKISLAGFEFTKPLTLDEIKDGQDIFVVNTYGGGIYVCEFGAMTTSALLDSIKCGFAQRDAENAKLQLQAISESLGREYTGDYLVVRLGSEPKKQRGPRKKKELLPKAANDDSDLQSEKIQEWSASVKEFVRQINDSSHLYELEQIQLKLADSTDKLNPDEIVEIRRLIAGKQEHFDKLAGEAAISIINEKLEKATTVAELNELEMDVKNQKLVTPVCAEVCESLLIDIAAKCEELNQLSLIDQDKSDSTENSDQSSTVNYANPKGVVNTFTQQIGDAKNAADLQKIELEINKFWSLDETARLDLKHRLQCKRDELDIPTTTAAEYQKRRLDAEEQCEYQVKLSELINLVENAQSIDEANEPVSQTLHWTVEQRLPLITAISKRLCELGKPLIAQIREAADLNTLEAYLIQIQELISVDGPLAHQCMQAYTVRKSILTPS